MNKPLVSPSGGIYVHVPFCLRKCAYCDFFSIADLSLKPAFLKALSADADGVEHQQHRRRHPLDP